MFCQMLNEDYDEEVRNQIVKIIEQKLIFMDQDKSIEIALINEQYRSRTKLY